MNIHSIDQTALLLLHQQSCKAHDLDIRLGDAQKLEQALAYPLNLILHGAPDIAALAAAYAAGIKQHQPFVAGNISTAFLAAGMFLQLNGWRLSATPVAALHAMQALANDEIDEAALADWIRENL